MNDNIQQLTCQDKALLGDIVHLRRLCVLSLFIKEEKDGSINADQNSMKRPWRVVHDELVLIVARIFNVENKSTFLYVVTAEASGKANGWIEFSCNEKYVHCKCFKCRKCVKSLT